MAFAPADQPDPAVNWNKVTPDSLGIAPLTPEEIEKLYATWPINWDGVQLKPKGQSWGDWQIHTPEEIYYPLGTRGNPDQVASKAADFVSDPQLDRYINEDLAPAAPADSPQTTSLRQRLAAEVTELISKPTWRPYHTQGGVYPWDHLQFFSDPSDVVYAIALAYPHLDPELRVKAKAYVDAQWRDQNPIVTNKNDALEAGEPRELYTVPPSPERILPPMLRETGIERLYIAWLWARNTGDWDSVKQLWPALREPNVRGGDEKKDVFNARCAGLIAGYRLARRFNDDEAAAAYLTAARSALRQRVAFEMRYHRGNVSADQMNGWTGWMRWTYLTPPVARLLREQTEGKSIRLMKQYLDMLSPTWFVNRGPIAPGGKENSMMLPTGPMMAFLGKAYLEGAPPEELERYIDVKNGRADLYYIQRLAITLDAYARPAWTRK